MWLIVRPKAIRHGLLTSINASYIKPEAEQLLRDSGFDEFSVSCDPMGLQITAVSRPYTFDHLAEMGEKRA